MIETLSARSGLGGHRVVLRFPKVKNPRFPRHGSADLLAPGFERHHRSRPVLWLRRALYRRGLRAALLNEPDSVLEDFGLSRCALQAYLARPFWRA